MTNLHRPLLRGRPPVAILGVPFDNLTMQETVQTLEVMIASRKPHYLVTANLDFLAQATEDIELRRILLDADMVICDGTPPKWASRLLSNPLVERVAGADLVPILIALAAQKDYRVFFLGATPASAEEAVNKLRQDYPTLQVDFYAPPFRKLLEMDHAEIQRHIQTAKPDLLFVCFGCPKQEKWIWMHYRSLGVPVCAGVGATLDFLSGHFKRAPLWMRKSGLEWFHRLAQEPRRLFRRYLKDIAAFSKGFALQLWCLRAMGGSSTEFLVARAERGAGYDHLRLEGYLHAGAVTSSLHSIEVHPEDDLFLDVSKLRAIDSTGLAWLIRMCTTVRANGRELMLVGVGSRLRQILKRMHLQGFFELADSVETARIVMDHRRAQETVAVVQLESGSHVRWSGEVTAANADLVWKQTKPLLVTNGRGTATVVLDLERVQFIDSTGLGLLIRAKKAAAENLVALTFAGLQPAVLNVVRLARLENYLLNTSTLAMAAPVNGTRVMLNSA